MQDEHADRPLHAPEMRLESDCETVTPRRSARTSS